MNEFKIYLQKIAIPLVEAISEQVNSIENIEITSDAMEADLLILPEGVKPEGGEYAPTFILESNKKYRLGEILKKIYQIISHPLHHVKDVALGSISFNPQKKLLVRDGRDILLTDKEVDILYYLIKNIGTQVSRERILKDVWKFQEGIDTHTLETHIYRLRQKIELNADEPDFLLTKENGYILNVQ